MDEESQVLEGGKEDVRPPFWRGDTSAAVPFVIRPGQKFNAKQQQVIDDRQKDELGEKGGWDEKADSESTDFAASLLTAKELDAVSRVLVKILRHDARKQALFW